MLSHIAPCVPVVDPYLPMTAHFDSDRRKRILAALGWTNSRNAGQEASLRVDEQTLARYYDHLTARLELPFVAYYPPPSSPEPADTDRCQVIDLLDPRTDLCDEIDGLYCCTRRGKFLVNLPLVELTVLPSSVNLQLLEDYEYWFWHWRN